MKMLSGTLAGCFVALSLLSAACGPPKQAALPDVEDESGSADMAGGDMAQPQTPSAEPGDSTKTQSDGASEMREKCCASCKEAFAADRSGAVASEVPCVDYTAALSPWCLEHFRANPTQASECK